MKRQQNPNIDREAHAWRIAMRWKTNSAFARALGKTHTTTQRWLESGEIPPSEQTSVIAAGKRDKVKPPIRPEDFVDKRKFDVPPAPPVEQVAVA